MDTNVASFCHSRPARSCSSSLISWSACMYSSFPDCEFFRFKYGLGTVFVRSPIDVYLKFENIKVNNNMLKKNPWFLLKQKHIEISSTVQHTLFYKVNNMVHYSDWDNPKYPYTSTPTADSHALIVAIPDLSSASITKIKRNN